MIPYKADVAMERWPWANWAIVAVTVVVTFASFFYGYGDTLQARLGMRQSIPAIMLFGSPTAASLKLALCRGEYTPAPLAATNPAAKALEDRLPVPMTYKFSPLQLVTHSLLHGGFMHLVGNMIFLFCFGNAVNAKVGHARYVLFYIVLGVVAGGAWIMWPGQSALLVGASGAIMGVAGMYLVFYPLNEVSLFTLIVYRPVTFHVSGIWVLLGYFLIDTFGLTNPGDNVAHISHVSGMAVGAAIAALFILAGIVKPGRGEKTLLEYLGIKVARTEPFDRSRRLVRESPFSTLPPAARKTIAGGVVPPAPRAPGQSARPKAAGPGAVRGPLPPRQPIIPVEPEDLPAIELEPLRPEAQALEDELRPPGRGQQRGKPPKEA
jgi:membrane associated rhomboid family serine protease